MGNILALHNSSQHLSTSFVTAPSNSSSLLKQLADELPTIFSAYTWLSHDISSTVDFPAISVFDHEISNKDLEYSDGGKNVKRVGGISCWPAAVAQIRQRQSVFAVKLVEDSGKMNCISIGIAKVPFPVESSDGFGKSKNSWLVFVSWLPSVSFFAMK